ncbi:MAG TPA: hypothetical protein VNB49_08010, partial [Candidatus Dormibacteraeota bacterium]|nr:hypothetical protein [Candidatus Dormibacteraeota bacterium]
MRRMGEAPEGNWRGPDGGDAVNEAMLASESPQERIECAALSVLRMQLTSKKDSKESGEAPKGRS